MTERLCCNVCRTGLVEIEGKPPDGGWLVQCPACTKTWSMGHSMTGPELVGMVVDSETLEFTGDDYGDSPLDTALDPFWTMVLLMFVLMFVLAFLGGS